MQSDSGCVCSFAIESSIIANLEYPKFRSKIINKKLDIQNIVAKACNVNWQQVETMIPIQTTHGVLLTFIIAADSNRLKFFDNAIMQTVLAKVKLC